MKENISFTSEVPTAQDDEPGGRGTGLAGEAEAPGQCRWHVAGQSLACVSVFPCFQRKAAEQRALRCGSTDGSSPQCPQPQCHEGWWR